MCNSADPQTPPTASSPIQCDKARCHEIASELHEMATYLAAGKLSPSTFRLALLTLETRKASRFGFTLRGETAPDGKSKFVLRFTETQKLCSGLEYDPATKKLALQEFCS